jgi:hypothetical protein
LGIDACMAEEQVGTGAAARGFGAIALVLAGFAALLLAHRHRFDYAFELIDIPSVPVALGLALAGTTVLALPQLIERAEAEPAATRRRLLALVVGVGLALRLAMFLVNPVLEDDYHRYLWDGAVTASGHNPFKVVPSNAANEPKGSVLARLAEEAGVVLERINHPDARTIYPPVAQAAFALAYLIEPFSMTAWRAVCLAGEIVTLALLLALLGAVGRSPLWAALYWWNPLVIKEQVNSAHMEAILMPLVLAALWLSVRRRPLAATGTLGLAIGAKLWPVMLAPIVLRPLLADRRRLLAALAILGVLSVLWALPPLVAGIDETSGFVAYARYWKSNSALFPLLEATAGWLTRLLGGDALLPGQLVRGASALFVAALSLWLARRPIGDGLDLLRRAAIVTTALFLVSPSQFPWYAVWVFPFLAFCPLRSLLLMAVTLPIYYASFYFHARDTYEVFRTWVVWLIWLPVWVTLAWEAWTVRRRLREAKHA